MGMMGGMDFQQMQQQMQQYLLQNPEAMQQIMNSPMMQVCLTQVSWLRLWFWPCCSVSRRVLGLTPGSESYGQPGDYAANGGQ